MNKINYDRMCMAVIRQQTAAGRVPTLLLHSCCAPCSSATLEWLSQYFRITVFYYNPNIAPEGEFQKRLTEQRRLIENQPAVHPVQLIAGVYEPAAFTAIAKGYEDCPEGGARCMRCYRQRLEKTAVLAKEMGFDYFCTTLSISPLKDAQKINAIGPSGGEQYGVAWLPSDFKKQERYKRSIALSREYGLYRQNFCGCIYSKQEKEKPV